ncbi:MAG: ATP-dependent DNA helicase PcrA [Chlamydiia bacterium]|nr:ATP-dependent DNA helicase PcrA [Chlamydiia bacterium]
MSIAAHLNERQKQAVSATKGRVLILAGAGSGKTSVLTYRMAHLIKNEGVDPSKILGLTFTNKAAQEMKQRVSKILSKKLAQPITLCTFHSFCMKVLRESIDKLGYTKQFSLYDDKDIKRLVTNMIKSELEHESELPPIDNLIKALKQTKHSGSSIDDTVQFKSKWANDFTKKLHENLALSMRAYNALDFDSLISLTVELFEKFPEVLESYQDRFHYIMIDEYQDTNPIQYKLATLLASKRKNLCVVGDDDQSIYAFRGAEVKHILEFDCDRLIKLEQNYRSSINILDAANAVIKNNTERHAKTLWSKNSDQIPIVVFHAPTEKEEADGVISRILMLKEQHGYKWKDFAILYRSNSLSRTFEMALMNAPYKKDGNWKRGIPYEVFGGLELIERSEVKDLFAYLKAISNDKDTQSLLRIINYPRRGISEKTLDTLTKVNRKRKIPLWNLLEKVAEDSPDYQDLIESLTTQAFKGIQFFTKLMTEAREMFASEKPHKALEWLIGAIDYKKAVGDEVKSEKMKGFKWENIDNLVEMIKNYEETEENASLRDFLSSSILSENKQKSAKSKSEDRVHLMTFHSSKGLEYPVCFLVGLEDHLIPHEKSLLENSLEEERRLMYVAITRCMKRLYLTMSRTRKKHGKDLKSSPSRFLYEIPNTLLKTSNWKFFENDHIL